MDGNITIWDDKGYYTKGFPEPFQTDTKITTESYVKTRRRDTGRKIEVRRLRNSHQRRVHVWLRSSQIYLQSPDCASVAICSTADSSSPQGRDEIKEYIDARYLGSSEACARIMGWCTYTQGIPLRRSTSCALARPTIRRFQCYPNSVC
ncbi:hypothetical protein EDB85DRAFT_452256 [Lactarius pseudohatsudake]|nr:hypothetical protein EDB85DRAFT_452256 [Lactarius pseudohatsudake]